MTVLQNDGGSTDDETAGTTSGDRRFTPTEANLLFDVLKHRRDVRGHRFLPDAVTDTEIDQLIEAALLGPSVGFSQPWEFVVIRSDAAKHAVQEIFREENGKAAEQFAGLKQQQYKQMKLEGIAEAPVNLAVFYKPANKPVLGQTSMSEMGLYSVVCAVQNLWLMARAMNIGVGWVSILQPEKIQQLLDVPKDRQLVAYLCVGKVSQFDEKPELETVGWDRRKRKHEVVFREHRKAPFYDAC